MKSHWFALKDNQEFISQDANITNCESGLTWPTLSVVTTNNAAVGMRQQVATTGAYIQQQQPTNNTLQTFQPQTSTLTFQQVFFKTFSVIHIMC